MFKVIRGIDTEPFSAETFLLTLRRSSKIWGKSAQAKFGNQEWLFRGQRNADWRLVPSAFRPEAFSNLPTSASPPFAFLKSLVFEDRDEIPVDGGQFFDAFRAEVTRELLALAAFHASATDYGFDVPAFPPEFGCKSEVSTSSRLIKNYWSVQRSSSNWQNLTDLVAVAQHHGVPTRFLDASLHPWKACHFAVAGWDCEHPTDIAVWAIQKTPWIAVHRPVSQNNPRILAQDGVLFQLEGVDHHYLKHGRWPDFPRSSEAPEELNLSNLNADVLRQHRMVQLVLNKSEVPKLTDLLQAERINEATLMRSLDGVAQTMKRQWTMGKLK